MCVCVFLPLEQHALDSISFLVPVQPQIQCYLCWLPHRPPTEQPDKPRDHHPKSSQCALSHPPIYLTTTPQTIPLASNSPFESDSPRIDNNRVTSTPSDGHSSLFHQHHHYSSSQHRHHQKLYHKKSSHPPPCLSCCKDITRRCTGHLLCVAPHLLRLLLLLPLLVPRLLLQSYKSRQPN